MMHNLSQMQLLALWVQLEDAYNNVNRYGGDIAEIYAYTLQQHSPMLDKNTSFGQEARTFAAMQAAESLMAVVKVFQEQRDCKIQIDEKAPKAWYKFVYHKFEHRCHIKVIRKEK